MATILSVLSQKGGASKSTLSTNLARRFQMDGYSVAIADLDPQGTSVWWSGRSDEIDVPVIKSDTNKLGPHLRRYAAEYDVVVIDGEPSMRGRTTEAIAVSDFVLIPVRAFGADVASAAAVVRMVTTHRERTGKPDAALLSVQTIAGTRLADEIEDALGNFPLPVLKGSLGMRVAYGYALQRGVSVFDMGSQAKRAAAEMESIYKQIKGRINV